MNGDLEGGNHNQDNTFFCPNEKITKNNDSALFLIILCCTEYLLFTFYNSELKRLPLQQQCYDILFNGKLITYCFRNSDVHVVVIHVVVYLLVGPRIVVAVVSIVASVYKHFLVVAKELAAIA